MNIFAQLIEVLQKFQFSQTMHTVTGIMSVTNCNGYVVVYAVRVTTNYGKPGDRSYKTEVRCSHLIPDMQSDTGFRLEWSNIVGE